MARSRPAAPGGSGPWISSEVAVLTAAGPTSSELGPGITSRWAWRLTPRRPPPRVVSGVLAMIFFDPRRPHPFARSGRRAIREQLHLPGHEDGRPGEGGDATHSEPGEPGAPERRRRRGTRSSAAKAASEPRRCAACKRRARRPRACPPRHMRSRARAAGRAGRAQIEEHAVAPGDAFPQQRQPLRARERPPALLPPQPLWPGGRIARDHLDWRRAPSPAKCTRIPARASATQYSASSTIEKAL